MRQRWVAGCVAAACTLLSGCWTQIGFDAGHSRFNSQETKLTLANVASLRQDWSVDVRAASSEPMVRGGRIYLTTADTPSDPYPQEVHVRALDAGTGNTVWDNKLLSWCCVASSLQAVPATLVGDEVWTGYLQAAGATMSVKFPVRLRSTDGALLGQEGNWPSSPAVEAGSTVVQVYGTSGVALGGKVVVRDKASLATLWTGGLPVANSPAPPAVVDGQIFVVSGPFLLAFPLAGCGSDSCSPTWFVNLGAGDLRSVAAAGGGDSVFVTSQSGEVIAVRRSTGAVAWRSGVPGVPTSDVAVANGTVYEVAGPSLFAFAASGCGTPGCSPQWTASGVSPSAGGPVVAGDVVYAGAPDGVKAFPAAGCGAEVCQAIASVPVTGEVRQLTVDDGRLLVVSRNPGHLTAFSPH